MPFHFYFNLKENLSKHFIPELMQFTDDELSISKFDELNLSRAKLLRGISHDKAKFDFFLQTILAPDGDFPSMDQINPLLNDYDIWKQSKPSIDFSKDPKYFVIERDILEKFIKDKLINKELIVKFGCKSKNLQYSNLSIFLGGMEINDYDFITLTDYIECDSETISPIKSNSIDSNFYTKIINFTGRFGGDITRVGISHNINTRIISGKTEYGFLSDFLNRNPNDKKIYIHPAFDKNHENNLTVIFSTLNDLTNLPTGSSIDNRIYDFGGGCCPPA